MPINKVVFGDQTIIDLTRSTLSSSDQIQSGTTAFDRGGNLLTGTLEVDSTYSVTQTLTNVTSSNDDSKVLQGGSFFAELTPTSGYAITSITVLMGGVDVTAQVFKPGTGAKAITANGTYSAASDGLSGYEQVTVNVPSEAAVLGTKTITANGTYAAASDDLDGYSSVTVNVPNSYTAADEGKVVSSGALVAQTSDTVTQNGTVDTTLISSLTVNVPTGGGGTTCVTGTFSPASNLRTVTLSDTIGKNNLAIFCQTNFNPAPINRTHGYDLFVNGKLLIVGSTNSGGTGAAATMTLSPEGNGRSGVTWDRTTGVVTISAGATSSYGGYYASGLTYGYCAW